MTILVLKPCTENIPILSILSNFVFLNFYEISGIYHYSCYFDQLLFKCTLQPLPRKQYKIFHLSSLIQKLLNLILFPNIKDFGKPFIANLWSIIQKNSDAMYIYTRNQFPINSLMFFNAIYYRALPFFNQ